MSLAPPDWTPDSWQSRPQLQQPHYADVELLQRVLRRLAELPPLVTSWEVEALRKKLAAAQQGRCFVLQGGDCAEAFADCRAEIITNRLKVLLQMSLVLSHGRGEPVLRIGRFAGQYAKPRSADTETRDGITLPSYRGDLVNAPAFTDTAREPDPRRLLRGYSCSALTLNFVRGLVDAGFADLHHPEYWNLPWVQDSPHAAEYEARVADVTRSLAFMEALAGGVSEYRRVDFYTSHEALLLCAEQAQTRQVPRREGWYNLSTHMPWIGARTAQLDGAHVEYCRGLRNPIGLKVGPDMMPESLLALCRHLDPDNEPGRLTLIHRMGATRIGESLPPLLDAVRKQGLNVLWLCDPMHGNTHQAGAYKTRDFDAICSEVDQAMRLHRQVGGRLGGVHLELTGENVTECTGGAAALGAADLSRAFRSRVDPRLNYDQSLELALELAGMASP
ncbi:MAG: 3-deoxy-7-phosphoheptulonate synthase class II [Sinobacteraceae bacterium]|nr:3-deoxy-7-phosphoheptulonate synthase class II [Nevskiaceae bacterium]